MGKSWVNGSLSLNKWWLVVDGFFLSLLTSNLWQSLSINK
jgi:hypothetical protein